MTGDQQKSKIERKIRRHQRIRAKIKGTADRPRLSVFRSNAHLYVQLIDDMHATTLCALTDAPKRGVKVKQTKMQTARALGAKLAELAKKKGIVSAVFDAGGNSFHGRTKEVAEGAREAGLVL